MEAIGPPGRLLTDPTAPAAGEIVFDNVTGEIVWQTTNADVTHDASGNALTGLAPYVFRIQVG